jgi:hypothetical protein
MNSDALLKLKMLKSSMRCFIFGLLGFIPLIGLPFALAALWISGRVRRLEKQFWNPARTYRIAGSTCAAVSVILWVIPVIIILGSVFWQLFVVA